MTYSNIYNPNIATLIATGPVHWPTDQIEHFAVIYEANLGKPFFAPDKRQAFGLKQDLIMEQFLPHFVGVLKDFHERGFVHGAIRADNIFGGSGHNLKSAILGDALTTPPSYLQPVLYEPIERAMADPIARGLGHFVDDVYALGVLLTVMLRSHDPLQGMSDEKIIAEKIEKGSYAALTGKDRFTGAILELLRGILHDSKPQRWTIDEVNEWMDGQRLNPKQTLKRKKAARVFYLEGNRYVRPELLARDLYEYCEHLPHYIDDGKLELWMQRSLEDKEAEEHFALAVESSKDTGINDDYKYKLASRISIALDPPAPIRYKGLSFHPEGFGTALAEAFIKNKNLNIFAEIIEQSLVMFWLNTQSDKTIDYGSISTRFESCRAVLKNRNAGFGLERCVYSLNFSVPCLSTKLAGYYVKSPEDMVYAFESLCKDGQIEKLFLDRHSIAFLSVKDSRILDSYLIELNSDEEYKKILGNVWTITNIQKRYEMPPLPHIAEHVVKIMDPVLERFHDRNLRARMQKEFEKIKKTGDLSRVTAILENPEIIETDKQSFFKAMKRYKRMEKEKLILQKKLEQKGLLGNAAGRTAAAIISTVIGGLGIITLALLELSGAGAF